MDVRGILTALSLLALLFAQSVSAPAQQKEPGQQGIGTSVAPDDFPLLFKKLRTDEEIQARWNACPADIYRSEAALRLNFLDSAEVDASTCEADPSRCQTECFDGGNENACFALGLALQKNEEDPDARYSEAMFAQACAAGHAGGCTNRAAGIMSGNPGDSFAAVPADIRDKCVFRSFEVTCRADDAWGCTMLGVSYEFGKGIDPNSAKAGQAYLKSCDLAADFTACDYAKEGLDRLKQ